MKLWILRFVPYEGGHSIDGYYRDEDTARALWSEVETTSKTILLVDDFGIHVRVDPKRCACILTNTEASASFQAALQSANQSAAHTYGLPALSKGSTVQ